MHNYNDSQDVFLGKVQFGLTIYSKVSYHKYAGGNTKKDLECCLEKGQACIAFGI